MFSCRVHWNWLISFPVGRPASRPSRPSFKWCYFPLLLSFVFLAACVAIWARQMYAVPFDKLSHFPPMSVIASSSPHLNKHKLKLKQKFSWTLQDTLKAKFYCESSFSNAKFIIFRHARKSEIHAGNPPKLETFGLGFFMSEYWYHKLHMWEPTKRAFTAITIKLCHKKQKGVSHDWEIVQLKNIHKKLSKGHKTRLPKSLCACQFRSPFSSTMANRTLSITIKFNRQPRYP